MTCFPYGNIKIVILSFNKIINKMWFRQMQKESLIFKAENKVNVVQEKVRTDRSERDCGVI